VLKWRACHSVGIHREKRIQGNKERKQGQIYLGKKIIRKKAKERNNPSK
jgi:hypothetical protein